MALFSRLSLRNKFLVAPAIGALIMLLPAMTFWFNAQLQTQQLIQLEHYELATAGRFMSLYGQMGANHSRVHKLLEMEGKPYPDSDIDIDRHKQAESIRKEINKVAQRLTEEAERVRHHLDPKTEPLVHQLVVEYMNYQNEVAIALEPSTGESDLVHGKLFRVEDSFDDMQGYFLALLENFRAQVSAGFATLKERSALGLNVFLWVLWLAGLAMALIALIFSHVLSRDLNLLIQILERLVAGDRDFAIPRVSASAEVNALAEGLEAFRETLRQLDERTADALRANAKLQQEVDERKRVQKELQLTSSVFEHSQEGIMITDAGRRILRVNQAFVRITGWPEEEAVGEYMDILRSAKHDEAFYQAMEEALAREGVWQGEIWQQRRNGEVYPEWRNTSAVMDAEGNIIRYVCIFSDITDKKLSEEHIHRLAHYDVVTNLPNRVLLQERLEQALFVARRHDRIVGLMFIDLDRFKLINDTLGHSLGDLLLREMARRLEACVRPGDTVARVGGDEFVVVLEDMEAAEDAGLVARRMQASISQPLELEGHTMYSTASIGISLYPEDGLDVATLFKNADTAMYRAKQQGGGSYQYFEEEMHQNALKRLQMETGLRHAIEHQEFLLHYQPQVNMQTGRIIGMEALLRWQHPELGLIPPNHFIPIAEETGIILPIGRWVIQAACAQYRSWLTQGNAPSVISINLSGRQFQDALLGDQIADIVGEEGVETDKVEFEITETFLMQNPEHSIRTLSTLQEMGFNVAIDDFGTAYSSLSYLKRFPVSRLKIDRSFIRDIPVDSDDMAITQAIISMAASLGLSVIAEGVETREQADFLLGNGCLHAQGYMFGRPLPAQEATELLQEEWIISGRKAAEVS